MLQIVWESSARAQVREIADFIAARNASAAERLERHVHESVGRLSALPAIGRPGRVPDTRELIVHPNYIVIYRVTSESVTIIRFLHARQRYP